ncbi:uncharacterized protein EI90DRAFT_3156512 [Cantharellus anzutake]|uniref:uncharacterized protein n=1 Tax=Cantharellus anzutake TaxID=1750568 RepID=UPI00190433AE|nr:uncharacterized protein EI90DRAFT_3156512 [Cantharellus anzutake]KAF8326574.1 hypothetical protein EI90DRAFT_3156512 [Cantharellus anzutake]
MSLPGFPVYIRGLAKQVIARHGPISNKDILRKVQEQHALMTKKPNFQISSPAPPPSSKVTKAPIITSPTPLPNMSQLKRHALQHLIQSRKWEKIHIRREATPEEKSTMSSNQRQILGSGPDNKVYISEWFWRRTPPKEKKASRKSRGPTTVINEAFQSSTTTPDATTMSTATANKNTRKPKPDAIPKTNARKLAGKALRGFSERPQPLVRRWLKPMIDHLSRRRQRKRLKDMAKMARTWRAVKAAKLLHQIETSEGKGRAKQRGKEEKAKAKLKQEVSTSNV